MTYLRSAARREWRLFSDSFSRSALVVMDTIGWVRQFFREQLAGLEEEVRRLRLGADGSTQHLISHLVDQTVRRAVLDATTYDREPGDPEGDVSWRDCLMVAALVELRSIKLLARNEL